MTLLLRPALHQVELSRGSHLATSLFHSTAIIASRPKSPNSSGGGSRRHQSKSDRFRQPQRYRLTKPDEVQSRPPPPWQRRPLGLSTSPAPPYKKFERKAPSEGAPRASAASPKSGRPWVKDEKRGDSTSKWPAKPPYRGTGSTFPNRPPRSYSPPKKIRPPGIKREFLEELSNAEHRDPPVDREPSVSDAFTSPPLLSGLVESLHEKLGEKAKPTPIQALAIPHFLQRPEDPDLQDSHTNRTLLASETGSGKSIAYLLPMLQSLKEAELKPSQRAEIPKQPAMPQEEEGSSLEAPEPPPTTPGPRAIVLAPTHELCRQLAAYAKGLSHVIKLRVQCLSNPNRSRHSPDIWDEVGGRPKEGAPSTGGRQVDVMVGTPSRVLSLAGGVELSDKSVIGASERTWELEERGEYVGLPQARMNLEQVEWVVIDEADVLLDRDFVKTTEAILMDVKLARQAYLERTSSNASELAQSPSDALPFKLVLSSATIPVALSNYLDLRHPDIIRLASPTLHRLPKTLRTDYVQWTGGNRMADIFRKIEDVWADDATQQKRLLPGTSASDASVHKVKKSKILIFCNEKEKVLKLAEYLQKQKGVECLTMVGDADARRKGSNKHLADFLSSSAIKHTTSSATDAPVPVTGPSVLITTSLLSRGLDFSPSIKHVFVVDEPRSAVDFIHRAGRTGRAGRFGTVVLFEKGSRNDRRKAKKAVSEGRKRISGVL